MPHAPTTAHPSDTTPLRIGDAHRNQVTALLSQAAAHGYLTRDELETRLAAVHRSTTVAQLDTCLSDLHVPELRRRDPARLSARAARARLGLRIHVAAYLMSTLLLVALWLAIALQAGAWYPWPVWPALGGGTAVAAHALALRNVATSDRVSAT